jgi:allantoinase
MTDNHDIVHHSNTTIVKRPRVSWPEGKPVAFAVVVSVEYYELQPPEGSFLPPNLPGGFGRAPYPDMRAFSQREYGNRVGIFRVMDALDRSAIRATAAIDATIAARYPYLVDNFRQRKWEIACHGLSLTQVVSNHMSAAEERDYISTSLSQVEQVSGVRPGGWHGPEYGESERTPMLLAEAGFDYVLDWPNDEQPYWMSTCAGPIVSIPMALELDDVIANYHRRIGMERWHRAVIEALDQLSADGSRNGRHLVLNIHPWLIGQPHRISFLEDVLKDVRSRSDVWIATAGEIAEHYRSQAEMPLKASE